KWSGHRHLGRTRSTTTFRLHLPPGSEYHDGIPMSSSSSSDPASRRVSARLSSRVLLALISLLTIALVAGCAEAGDANATSDDSAWSTEEDPTPQENRNSGSDEDDAEDDEDAEAAAEDSEDSSEGGEDDSSEVGRAGSSTPGAALAMLDELTIKGRAPKTGYDPDVFKWRSDADHTGCDTRNDVLRRDLKNITLKAGTKGCVVIAGDLADDYKGETFAFDRSPNNIDIDHIVARSNAWQTGAADVDENTLKEFGNDPLNLLAVSANLNRQKGDGDADRAGTKGCVVIAGDLADDYKGETFAFDRSPNNIDIDHIVARSNAWQTGAADFDENTLKEFGNDPLNLLAVSSNLNRQKGDGD